MSTLCSVVSAASAQLSALLSSLAPREIYYIGGPEPLPAPLTPAEEQALLARLDTDGAAVRTTLIEHNLRLVVFIARKFDNTGIMLEDLISIGTIGLIKAVNTFDPWEENQARHLRQPLHRERSADVPAPPQPHAHGSFAG